MSRPDALPVALQAVEARGGRPKKALGKALAALKKESSDLAEQIRTIA